MMRRLELNHMNALACLAVILIHVLSLAISSLNPGSWQAAVIYLPWRLAAFVVPMFLYTGAVKLSMQFLNSRISVQTYFHYLLRRIQKIYLPYVLWVILYYLSFLPIHYVKGSWEEFFSYLLSGSLSSPFYYIVIVMQFYALMPLWVWMVRKLSPLVGIGLSLLVTLVMQQLPSILPFPYYDRVFSTYLLFWTVGLYIGRFYEQTVPALRGSWNLMCSGAAALGCAVLACYQYVSGQYLFDLNLLKLMADLMSIFFLHGLCLILTCAPAGPQRLLGYISKSSFFVYLSHCLFLTLATAFLQGMGVNSLSYLLPTRFAVCYTVPFLLYFLYQKATQRLTFARGILG